MSVLTIDELKITVGRRIVAMRERHSLLQNTLATAIGVTNSSLSYYEHGERPQPIWVLLKIARFCGEPLSALVSEHDQVVTGWEDE